MDVKELRPRLTLTRSSLQCDVDIPMLPSWNPRWLEDHKAKLSAKGYDPNKCSRGATVKIDGRPLCRQHAGAIAIETLVLESRVEALQEPKD